MKFTTLFTGFAVAATAHAGNLLRSSKAASQAPALVDIETVYVVEYTEICQCPIATASPFPVPAITTITCCDSCAPVTITKSAQPVTSCTTSIKPTSTICNEVGIYKLGDNFYPCNNAPCTIQYSAPCPTCYVCPYSDCWAPNAGSNQKTKHVQVYEYVQDKQVGHWGENWECSIYTEFFTRTKSFAQPTIYIENNITINITVAPTVVTYTATSSYTTTTTTTVTATDLPIQRSTTSVPSAAPSSTTSSSVDLRFILHAVDRQGLPIITRDGKLAYGSMNDTVQTVRLINNSIYDAFGNILYISDDDVTYSHNSYLYFVPVGTVPATGLTNVFSIDGNQDLIVTINGQQLVIVICDDDGFIRVGFTKGTCEAVILNPSPVTLPSSTPSAAPSSSVPSSVAPSAAPSSTPSASPSSNVPSTPASSVTPVHTGFNRLVANPSPMPFVINQASATGSGTVGIDMGIIDLTSIDANNQTVAGTKFYFQCTNLSGCVISLTSGGPAVTSGVADSDGKLRIFVSSPKGGSALIDIYGPDDVITSIPVTFTQILDCTRTIVSISNNTSTLGSLIIGLDNPEMNVNLYDINGDPMPGVEVTYSFTLSGLPLGKRKVEERGVARSSISGSDGVATYTGTEGIDQTWGSVNWFATPQTCPEQAFTSMFWFYSVDCDASTVEITPSSLFQNEVLQVKGTYAPGTPGASIQNAQIQVQSSPDNLFLSLQSNNSFYGQSVWSAGVPLTPVASLYNFYFLGSIQPCFKLGYPVFWKSTTPDCAVSTMQYVTTWSAGSASTVVTLHVSNSQLDLIPNVPFHFFGTTDPFTYDGTTDEFGAAQFTWPNSGSDLGTVTLGTTGSSCIKVLPVAEG